MKHSEMKIGIDILVLERCDELEEMAVRMAREIAHLRSMLEYAKLQQNEAKPQKPFYVPEPEARHDSSYADGEMKPSQ